MSAGRFPKSEIISLLDVHRRHNLGESTSCDLSLRELVEQSDLERLLDLRLGYGSSKGSPALRKVIADHLGISADTVLTTQGAALSLFLTNFELCRAGDEIVVATPCFPPTIDAMRATGATLVPFKLSFADGYRIDEAAIVSTLNPKVKLVSIASPQNPSGVTVFQATIMRLVEAVQARAPEAFLVVDQWATSQPHWGRCPKRWRLHAITNPPPRISTMASCSSRSLSRLCTASPREMRSLRPCAGSA